MAYNHYRHNPGWGTQQVGSNVGSCAALCNQLNPSSFSLGLHRFQVITHNLHVCMPDCRKYQIAELISHTGTGQDFYSAHAMGGDP